MNVRRLFIYIEHSIDKGMWWAVFESNNVQFHPKDRESSMPHTDIDNGRSVCVVGIAALRSAEFVIFRVGQQGRVAAALELRGHRVFWG